MLCCFVLQLDEDDNSFASRRGRHNTTSLTEVVGDDIVQKRNSIIYSCDLPACHSQEDFRAETILVNDAFIYSLFASFGSRWNSFIERFTTNDESTDSFTLFVTWPVHMSTKTRAAPIIVALP